MANAWEDTVTESAANSRSRHANQVTILALDAAHVPAILTIITNCRREYGLEGRLPSLLEPADYAMLKRFSQPRSGYFTAMVDGVVAGGGGIAPLAGGTSSICELQRMYVSPVYRGLGVGQRIFIACLEAARASRYEQCYAETIAEMTAALAFYRRHGFRDLAAPLGQTGHHLNDRWLLLDIGRD
jgi:putative acetyltransferase